MPAKKPPPKRVSINTPMPHNALTEYGVLVALLHNKAKRWDELAVELTPSDFFDPDHHLIFTHAERIANAGETISGYHIALSLAEEKTADHPAVKTAIALDTESSMHDPHELIKQVRADSVRRDLITHLQDGIEQAYERLEQRDPQEVLEGVLATIQDQSRTQLSRDELAQQSVIAHLPQVREDLAYLKQHGHPPDYLETGFTQLDRITWGGFRPGHLYVLAGRPGTGKTSMAVSICVNLLDPKRYVDERPPCIAFVSLEQTANEIMIKIMSQMSGVPFGNFKTGRLSSDHEIQVANAMGDLEQVGGEFLLINPPGLNISQFSHRVKQVKRTYGHLDLVVVDYVGLMNPMPSRREQNRATEIAEITRGMKQLAIQEGVPILALAQVNRNPEGRSNQRPRLADLRDSGAIEQDADLVMMLYKEDENSVGAKPDYNKYELIIAKNRHGEVKTINLMFHEQYTAFDEHDDVGEPLPDSSNGYP